MSFKLLLLFASWCLSIVSTAPLYAQIELRLSRGAESSNVGDNALFAHTTQGGVLYHLEPFVTDWRVGALVNYEEWQTAKLAGVASMRDLNIELAVISSKRMGPWEMYGKFTWNLYSVGKQMIHGFTDKRDISSPFEVLPWEEFSFSGVKFFSKRAFLLALGVQFEIFPWLHCFVEGLYRFGYFEVVDGRIDGVHPNGSSVVSAYETLHRKMQFSTWGGALGVASRFF
jgi:hypothetical protein